MIEKKMKDQETKIILNDAICSDDVVYEEDYSKNKERIRIRRELKKRHKYIKDEYEEEECEEDWR